MNNCPCGSGLVYNTCCQPLHEGAAADSPEALMRSRFSAFSLNLESYLIDSWHEETRPSRLDLDTATQWKRLEIISAGKEGNRGKVHFKATYFEHGSWHLLEESSVFIFTNNHWFYHSGDYQPQRLDPKRNDGCPCGSGQKYKKCCL